jgi:hypothetical protein
LRSAAAAAAPSRNLSEPVTSWTAATHEQIIDVPRPRADEGSVGIEYMEPLATRVRDGAARAEQSAKDGQWPGPGERPDLSLRNEEAKKETDHCSALIE